MKTSSNLVIIILIGVLLQCSDKPTQPDQPVTSRTLLAIFAHPDDESTISPLLAKYAAEGVNVYLALATDGRLGFTEHAQIPKGDSLASVRAEEIKCAAEKLGIQPPIMFGLEDQLKLSEGYGAFTGQIRTMREKVTELFNTLKPDVVITWDASGWTGHPDHRLVGSVVTEVFQSQAWEKATQLYYPAIPTGNVPDDAPFSVATIDASYLTVQVPVSAEDYEKARVSLHCHKSQYTPEEADALHKLESGSLNGIAYLKPYAASAQIRKSIF
jgi:LmbE family N-acetylglucosaminyl deacetylase